MALPLKSCRMKFPETQIEELKKVAPDLSFAEEGGLPYFLIKNLPMPEGCEPSVSDVLLCAAPRDGYESRLFFPKIIAGKAGLNWNGNLRVLDRNWVAFSWRTAGRKTLVEMLMVHLNGLRK